MHAAPTQGIGVDSFDRLIEVRALSHGFGQMIQMTSMIYNGVYDQFPKLKVAYAEAGCGWVPYLMERLDMEYEHRNTQVPTCKQLPSEHLKSGRIFIHCELEDRGIAQIAELLRDDILFCATDFPHEPRSEFHENIEKFMAREGCSRRDQTKDLFRESKTDVSVSGSVSEAIERQRFLLLSLILPRPRLVSEAIPRDSPGVRPLNCKMKVKVGHSTD